VKVTYVELLTRRDIMRLRHRELNLAQLFQKAVEERIASGISPEFERLQAEIQLAQAKNNYEEARWTFHSQRYTLFTLIGLDADEQGYDIQFPDSLSYTELNIPQKLALDGVEKQPLMRYYELMEKIADKEISLAKSQLLPDLSVGIFTQDINGESRKKGFEAGISLPLWYPLVQKGETNKAKAEKRSAAWELAQQKLLYKQEIENIWHGYDSEREIIRQFHTTIRSRSQELLNLTLEQFRTGETGIMSFLEAQRIFIKSEEDYLQAVQKYYQSLIRLERFVGKELVFITEETKENEK
jgi:outer membrane protein, heavy metal efflux system